MKYQPKRIQLKRTKGWRMPPNAKSVARPHKWGNPYSVDEYGLEKALALHRDLMEPPDMRAEVRADLRGYDLACFCRLDQPCCFRSPIGTIRYEAQHRRRADHGGGGCATPLGRRRPLHGRSIRSPK